MTHLASIRPRSSADRQGSDEGTVSATYSRLVRDGVYSERTRHADPERNLVLSVLGAEVRRLEPPVRVLEVGCGAGPWLEETLTLLGEGDDLSGFDLSDEMAALARTRLEGRLPEGSIWQGSALDDEAYRSPGDGYDIIYAYDVVQQLPPRLQLQACRTMIGHLGTRGCVVIFDHDATTPYGRRMGLKKGITRYLGVPLVPRYYLLAQYPPLRTIAERLLDGHAAIVRVAVARGTNKQALIAHPRF